MIFILRLELMDLESFAMSVFGSGAVWSVCSFCVYSGQISDKAVVMKWFFDNS